MRILLLVILLSSIMLLDLSAQEDVLRPRGRIEGSVQKTDMAKDSPWAFGVELGANYNMFSQDVNWDPQIDNSIFDVYSEGDGFSLVLGGFIDYSLTDKIGIHSKLLYDTKDFSNNTTGSVDCPTYESGVLVDFTVTDADIEFDYNLLYFNIELLLRYEAIENLQLFIGPTFQFGFGDVDATESITLDENNDCFFYENVFDPTSNRSKTTAVQSTLENASARIGLSLGLGYQVNVTEKVFIVPQLFYQHVFTELFQESTAIDDTQAIRRFLAGEQELESVVTTENSMLHSLRFSVALWFDM